MLHEICDGGHPKLMEADLLILWVHYHDILAKFTSKHWNTQSAEKSSIYKVQGMASSLASVADDQEASKCLWFYLVLIEMTGPGHIWMLIGNDKSDCQNVGN